MKKLFVKYSKNRRDEFKIKTEIFRDEMNEIKARKVALKPDGLAHIKQMSDNFSSLKKIYNSSAEIVASKLEGNTIEFSYLEGETLDCIINDKFKVGGIEQLIKDIQEYKEFIYQLSPLMSFEPTKEFEKIFGQVTLTNMQSHSYSNVDLIFDNIIIKNDKKYIIDYEWVFPFTIPINYILYRAVNVFLNKYRLSNITNEQLKQIFEKIGINDSELECYVAMEDNLMKYIGAINVEQYCMKSHQILSPDKRQVLQEGLTEWGNELDYELKDKNSRIQELAKWGNELDHELKDKDSRIQELAKWGNELDHELKDKDDKVSELAKWGNNLEQKIEELLHWGNELDIEIKNKQTRIEELAKWGNDLEIEIKNKGEMILELQNNNDKLQEENLRLMNQYKQEIERCNAVIVDLQEELNIIKQSNGYKFLLKYYAIRDKVKFWIKGDNSNQVIEAKPVQVIETTESETPVQDMVTIVIPVYNNVEYLEKCFESALAQTYENLEVLVVDDCSPDNRVKEIIDKYIDNPRFKAVYNKVNQGISETMNDGICQAKGDWIGFLDCDDWLEVDAVEKLMNVLKAKNALYGYTDRFNEYKDHTDVECFKCRPTYNYFNELLIGMYVSHLKIIHKDVFKKIGLHEKRYDGAQDYDIALKTAFHFGDAAFAYLSEPVYHHRIHDKQTTNEAAAKIQKIVEKIKEENRLRADIKAGKSDKLVSIVILSFEKKEMTVRCIEAIKNTVKVPHEIILFDNASLPETVSYLKENLKDVPGLTMYFSDKNLGCPGGRRKAIKMAKGDYIINLDNDIIVTENWLEELIVRAESQEKVGAVCCKTIFPNEDVQFNGGYYTIQDDFIKFYLIDTGLKEQEICTAKWLECDWVPGGATLFKKEIVDRVDYSEGYVNAYEDNDVALQIDRMGYKLLNCPTAKVIHYHIMFDDTQKKEDNYMKARYNQEGFVKSFENFYERNNLIIDDEFIFGLLGYNSAQKEEVKAFIKNKA
nr:glycosyltransferase [uncultured Cellulosilyticum sp.]